MNNVSLDTMVHCSYVKEVKLLKPKALNEMEHKHLRCNMGRVETNVSNKYSIIINRDTTLHFKFQ